MKCSNTFLLIVAYLFINLIQQNESAKILAIFPFPGPSQYILVKPFLKTLAARGHELTVLNAFPSKENVKNYRDIPIMEAHEIQKYYMQGAVIERNIWSELTFTSEFFYNVTRSVLRCPQVQELLQTESFDLAIIEIINSEAWYSFGPHFGVPIIGVSSFGSDLIINEIMGNPAPFSYTPSMGSGFTEEMTYMERLQNVVIQLIQLLHNYWVHLPRQQQILEEYMPHIKDHVRNLRRNISLFLLNQHFSLSFARPNVPNMIEVGGFQIPAEPNPLPEDIRSIIDNSTQDIIYFSMGSNVKSKDFPPETLKIFNEVFAQLPYTVLWKYENPQLPGKPSNVFINPWFPQADILAEEKVKLFISHGGLLSTFEAVHHGKPMLGIPIFFDQNLNVNNAEKRGFALKLDVKTLTPSLFRDSILEMMHNSSYRQKAKEISQRYHDKPMKPLDLAIYWTEYIIRHRGAPHLRSPAQKMNILQSHSLDTVGVLLIAALLIMCLIKLIFQYISKSLFISC
ncbi:UDP-glucosyltransferase 2-like [Musca vetustissima]|uniref:UDP-glucosyltransferase 2-like n=1 Tax=Musca vetustissima TaxID=27455 RepID=UPI002AB63DFA|nr:UDP-glucosyltransferase 2-like [Musca vetustissima]